MCEKVQITTGKSPTTSHLQLHKVSGLSLAPISMPLGLRGFHTIKTRGSLPTGRSQLKVKKTVGHQQRVFLCKSAGCYKQHSTNLSFRMPLTCSVSTKRLFSQSACIICAITVLLDVAPEKFWSYEKTDY